MKEVETVAPHPPLTDYYADEAERHRWLRTIFNASAVDYDRIEGLDGVRHRSLVSQAGASASGIDARHAGTRCRYRHRAHCDPGRAPKRWWSKRHGRRSERRHACERSAA